MASGLTMNSLVTKMVEDTDLTEKQVRSALKGLIDSLQETLSDEGAFVTVPGLGTFRSVKKGDRMARNPRTGEQSYVEPYLKVTFKASNKMSETVNGR